MAWRYKRARGRVECRQRGLREGMGGLTAATQPRRGREGTAERRRREGGRREKGGRAEIRASLWGGPGAAHGLRLPRSHACLLLGFPISPIIIPDSCHGLFAVRCTPFQYHQSHLSIHPPSLFPSACSQAHVPPLSPLVLHPRFLFPLLPRPHPHPPPDARDCHGPVDVLARAPRLPTARPHWAHLASVHALRTDVLPASCERAAHGGPRAS
ncbi:hypothetical protein BD310DRAFT_402165 [Dichomitus squalens]|uniref:Uncharacterized protein n=1 Tax=Dichomitus squalens TaxID=114155 RepID=A0A4Q9QBJ0_9APHY|nr:hypothetical protein BD310DRAFT_402165 [Dichomitus squalens]